MGHHPFGAFSKTMGISHIYRDAVLRNYIVLAVSRSVERIHSAISDVESYLVEYFYDHFSATIAPLSTGRL
jgi:hypothetical protein